MYVGLAALLTLLAIPAVADTPLNSFADVSQWRPNADGGREVAVSADREHAEHGPAMRIKYVDAAPHWGNLTGPCSVPGDARALRFWVYKHATGTGAAMHIWLFEPDGDGWVQQARFDDKGLGQAGPGWHEVRMPVSGFTFEPRGQKTREMTAVNRMLIGCNYGDVDVSVAAMTWETGTAGVPVPLPRTDNLRIETGKLGSVGILDMGGKLPDGFRTAHAPAALAAALRGAGFGATVLKPGDLADPTVLQPQRLEAVILPFGPYFPLEAKGVFLAYLKAGGSFLATDGYAFDKLVVLTEAGWSAMGVERTAAQTANPASAPTAMNARVGQQGDAMTFSPDQIGVFDPQFPLQDATQFRTAAALGQDAGKEALRYDFDKPVTGFSACGMIGVNSPVFPDVYRRWVPVLNAFDRTGGGLRGAALSIMHNYTGAYAKSSWAFSGLTSQTDLFLGSDQRRALLRDVVGSIVDKAYLHELTTDLACYDKGETATIEVKVSDFGRRPAERTVAIKVGNAEMVRRTLKLIPGDTRTISATVKIDSLKGDYIPVRATMLEGDRTVDTLDTAFCIRSAEVLASGPKLRWEGNLMSVNGRSRFLVGSNQTGMMYYSPHETPAVWDADFRNMAAHDFHILRILHFSPFAKDGYQGNGRHDALDLAKRPPERLIRQMDAIVQLAQKHQVALFLSLHDWVGVGLTDEQLKAEAEWDRFWAERYKGAPGLFYDIQNEPAVDVPNRPDMVALWNRFLAARYGTDEALRAAWKVHPPEAALPNVPLGGMTNDWYDVRSADRKRFETEVLNRWVKANADGIRAGNPNALCTVGYLPSMPPADKILGVKYTDFSNMHYYGGTEGFMSEFKQIDRRFVGKGFSLGECGAQEAHDARNAGSFEVPVEESVYRFQTYAHYAPAMGAAFICNWCWKDFDEAEFPWGLMHRSSPVTKPWLHTWEQEALFLSLAQPAYESPQVFILAPDQNRIGPHFDELHSALRRAIDLMLSRRANFGMVNEEDLDKLPATAKALLWPVPYCPTDETFDRVLKWVQAGGTLYVSGDVQFDSTRKATRQDRRKQLGLPEASARSPFETPDEAWAQAPVETAVGAGKVLYVPYPLELRGQAGDDAVYARFLALAGLSPIAIEPADASVRALSVPTHDGGRLTMLARTTDGQDKLKVSLPAAKVSVELAGRGYAFVLVGPGGQVRAAESQGEITIDGRRIASGEGHFGVGALDGRDLRQSQRVVVFPHQCASVDVGGLAGLRGAKVRVARLADDGGASAAAFSGPIAFSLGTPGQVAVIAPEGQLGAAEAKLRALRMLQPDGK